MKPSLSQSLVLLTVAICLACGGGLAPTAPTAPAPSPASPFPTRVEAPVDADTVDMPDDDTHTDIEALHRNASVAATDAPAIRGALERSVIEEVVERRMSQIRYCYQRELHDTPTLSGIVMFRLTIANDGSVSQASVHESPLNNEAVESCVTGRFMRMQFPEPPGGGIVIVSYPLTFSPG